MNRREQNLASLKRDYREFYSLDKSFNKLISSGLSKEVSELYYIFNIFIDKKISWDEFTEIFRQMTADKKFFCVCKIFQILKQEKIETLNILDGISKVKVCFCSENAKRLMKYFLFRRKVRLYFSKNFFEFRKNNNLEKDFEVE